jgi:hypothetical protein
MFFACEQPDYQMGLSNSSKAGKIAAEFDFYWQGSWMKFITETHSQNSAPFPDLCTTIDCQVGACTKNSRK